MNHFEGIWIPLVTPFRDGAVDTVAAVRLARHLAAQGVAGFVVCGTTGEDAALDESERIALLQAVVDAVGAHQPVVMGLAGSNTAKLAAQAARYACLGIAGLLLSAPAYVRPTQQGIRRHFETIAAAVPQTPMLIYNIPYRTGVNIDVATCRALAENPQFVAIKDSGGGNLNQTMDLLRETPLKLLCGEDASIFVSGCLGGHGAISAAAHILPGEYVRMDAHLRRGELPAARAIHERLLPLIRALFAEPNPAPLKAALAMQGHIEDGLRLPMLPASADCRAQLRQCMLQLGAL